MKFINNKLMPGGINSKIRRSFLHNCDNWRARKKIFLVLLPALVLCACGNRTIPMAYQVSNEYAAFKMFDILDEMPTARPFAADLVVVPGDYFGEVNQEMMEATGAAIFGTDDKSILYAKNIYEQLSPASLTKIMTALVALKYGIIDTFITASGNVSISEARAQTVGLERGDQLTLSQALHLSLINSANDAAIVVAEGVAGTVEEFVLLMNREARALGATNTNFMNPHGLTHENQYSTIYDMYLILNAAVKYDLFNHIISLPSYTTTYVRANGDTRELSIQNTNQYLQGSQDYPENIVIIGGKTGTTQAAGHCLAIVAKNNEGKTFLSVIMRADTRESVYDQTTELLRQIR
ncbi:MAG: D-alanyl-D-alanine carboxypeptidase [Lachnospiraceae bacterium]|nr:D-alanyl-D-alanine carboxypeptidase [Lachnospiraceae bacterium]